MSVFYADDAVTVHHGDCLDVLRAMPGASVDAVCTDPPYGLADHHPRVIAAALSAWLAGDREHVPDGKGFMGRDWDRFVPPPAVWDECWRVLKPGGHLLAFAGARTADLMGMSIRLAGFEIRDGIDWLYASGFPKSLNVSRAADQHRAASGGARVTAVRAWLNARRIEAGLSLKQVNDAVGAASNGGGLASMWMTNPSSRALPSLKQWTALKHLIGFGDEMDAEVARLNEIADGLDRPVVGQRANGFGVGRGDVPVITAGRVDLTGAATEEARQWVGWGTALKPAREPIVVARKIPVGTVAASVTTYGTGALNIAGCRVPAKGRPLRKADFNGYSGDTYGAGRSSGMAAGATDLGRWPSNIVLSHAPDCEVCECGWRGPLDDVDNWHNIEDSCRLDLDCVPGCPVAELDRQSGTSTSRAAAPRTGRQGDGWRMKATGAEYDDQGGASRFFPVFRFESKASSAERPRVNGVAHNTVKPLSLMRWLVRLVTPPGGVVLEPFAGSGTTAEACVLEGFRCIAVERDATYLPLITARLSKPLQPSLDLFGGAA